MALAEVFGPGTSPSGLVDKLIGDAFPIVRHVSNNIEYVKHVSAHLPEVYRVWESVAKLDTLYNSIENLDIVFGSIDAVNVVYANITKVNTVSTNIVSVVNVSGKTTEITALYNDLAKLVILHTNLTAFTNLHSNLNALVTLNGNTNALFAAQIEINAKAADVASGLATYQVDGFPKANQASAESGTGEGLLTVTRARQMLAANGLLSTATLATAAIKELDKATSIIVERYSGVSQFAPTVYRLVTQPANVQPTHSGKFQDNLGRWWEMASAAVYAEAFGFRRVTSGSDTSYDAANNLALARAFAYQNSFPITNNVANRASAKPTINIGPGVFRLGTGWQNPITWAGFSIKGAGKYATTLIHDGVGIIFDIGVFNDAPVDAFFGTAAGWKIEGMSLIRSPQYHDMYHGLREGQGIRDNGCGSGTLIDVKIGGFKYGWNNVCGADFSISMGVDIELCDVGFYNGPGGQQQQHDTLNIYRCQEDMVLDRPGQCTFDNPVFNGASKSCITIEIFDGSDMNKTRQIRLGSTGGIFPQQMQIVFNEPWFESNAGGLGEATIPDLFVEFRNNGGVEAYRDIRFNNPIIVAGSTGTKQVGAFAGGTGSGPGGQRIFIDKPFVYGTLAVWGLGAQTQGIVYNPRAGQVAPGNFNIIDDVLRQNRYASFPSNPVDREVSNSDFTVGIRERFNADKLSLAFKNAGVWVQRMGFDLANRRLFLDDPEVAASFSVARAGSMPSSGTFGIGSFVFNTSDTQAAAHPILGWKRLTTGSAHVENVDWEVIYGESRRYDQQLNAVLNQFGTGTGIGNLNIQNAGDNGSGVPTRRVLKGYNGAGENTLTFDPNGVLVLEKAYMHLKAITAPIAPATGAVLYVDAADGKVKIKNAANVVTNLTA